MRTEPPEVAGIPPLVRHHQEALLSLMSELVVGRVCVCVCVCVCEGGCGISEGVRVSESKRQCTCTHVFLLNPMRVQNVHSYMSYM